MDDIKSIVSKFKSVVELRKYTEDLHKQLQQSLLKLKEQELEINSLKSNNNAIIAPSSIPSNLLLCEMEIARLQKIVETRPLTIEETKQFDIYNRNLLNIKKPMGDKSDDYKIEFNEDELLNAVKK